METICFEFNWVLIIIVEFNNVSLHFINLNLNQSQEVLGVAGKITVCSQMFDRQKEHKKNLYFL